MNNVFSFAFCSLTAWMCFTIGQAWAGWICATMALFNVFVITVLLLTKGETE